jgi:hypothetical protein
MYGRNAPLASFCRGASNFGAKQKLFFGALAGRIMVHPRSRVSLVIAASRRAIRDD